MDFKLIHICIGAFSAVMIILAFLAFTMTLITMIFPAKKKKTQMDAAVIAAISGTVAARYAGARVTAIEELKG